VQASAHQRGAEVVEGVQAELDDHGDVQRVADRGQHGQLADVAPAVVEFAGDLVEVTREGVEGIGETGHGCQLREQDLVERRAAEALPTGQVVGQLGTGAGETVVEPARCPAGRGGDVAGGVAVRQVAGHQGRMPPDAEGCGRLSTA